MWLLLRLTGTTWARILVGMPLIHLISTSVNSCLLCSANFIHVITA
jgi:hypothetical protein